jgi:ADP-ribose pyrophosphatase YjhB (NUDIX family)
MTVPRTPMVGADTFVVNDKQQACLIRRSDNGLWALPGGAQDLGETPRQCAVREFFEETGFRIEIIALIGVFSSLLYEQTTNVNRGREVVHLLFVGRIKSGEPTPSEETPEIKWFSEAELPKFSDGHEIRVRHGFTWLKNPVMQSHFE